MATTRVGYLDKHGLGTLVGLIKQGVTGAYTVKGRAIYADAGFLALSSAEKEAIATGASAIDSAGIWQLINNVWTKITAFDEGYVYDIINEFTTDSTFQEGAGHSVPAGENIVAINVGTPAVPVLKWDLFSGIVNLSAYQTKALVAPLTTYENETPTVYTTAASLPASEAKATATITDLMVAIIGGTSAETGNVYRAAVTTDLSDPTLNTIIWVKLGNQTTVEGALQLLSKASPNTPISDTEIEAIWNNA